MKPKLLSGRPQAPLCCGSDPPSKVSAHGPFSLEPDAVGTDCLAQSPPRASAMPSAAAAAATTGHHHSTRRRLPGVTILALCMLTAGWIAFTVLASSPDYTDFESQATHFDAVAGRGDSHDASRGSGAAPPTLLHRIGLAAGAGKQRVELAVDPSTADDEALAFTVQHNNIPSSNAFSHAAAPRSARDSLTNKLRIKLDRTATLLGDLLLGLFGIDDGAEWFSEGDFDYETSQSGLDGGTLSSWSESSVYVEVSPFLRLCTTDKAAADKMRPVSAPTRSTLRGHLRSARISSTNPSAATSTRSSMPARPTPMPVPLPLSHPCPSPRQRRGSPSSSAASARFRKRSASRSITAQRRSCLVTRARVKAVSPEDTAC